MKKLNNNEKRILREDIKDLKWLVQKYKDEGKVAKAASCEKELDELKKKLKGGDEDEN